MTEFKKFDRVRVLDVEDNREDSWLEVGAVHTVKRMGMAAPGDRILVIDGPGSFDAARFELVERMVSMDRFGQPLYVGDLVQREGSPHTPDYEAFVVRDQHDDKDYVYGNRTDGGFATMARGRVTLVRHHWEYPNASMNAALREFQEAKETFEKAQMAGVEALVRAATKAIQAATPKPEAPKLPTEPGSIVAPANEADRSEAVLIGGKWMFTGGQGADPTKWPGGWRVKRDAGKENPR